MEQRTFTSSSPLLLVKPETDWVQNAVSHYFRHFVVDPADGLPGIHDQVPWLYSHYPDRVYLQSAVQAVAVASLARVKRMGSSHLLKAQQLYGEAVRGLRFALGDAIESRSASALVTTELLSQYDVCDFSIPSP